MRNFKEEKTFKKKVFKFITNDLIEEFRYSSDKERSHYKIYFPNKIADCTLFMNGSISGIENKTFYDYIINKNPDFQKEGFTLAKVCGIQACKVPAKLENNENFMKIQDESKKKSYEDILSFVISHTYAGSLIYYKIEENEEMKIIIEIKTNPINSNFDYSYLLLTIN